LYPVNEIRRIYKRYKSAADYIWDPYACRAGDAKQVADKMDKTGRY
jgi:hypothetical protein